MIPDEDRDWEIEDAIANLRISINCEFDCNANEHDITVSLYYKDKLIDSDMCSVDTECRL